MSELLAKSLLAGVGLTHPAHNAKLIETHISWLVLVGDFAYKLKKPVDLGFLDFSSVDKRKRFCDEEVRLNTRTARDIYLDVLPISGTESKPRVGDDSEPFEYMVRMHRFDESDVLENLAARGELDEEMIAALARDVAAFHRDIERDPRSGTFGSPGQICKPVNANFVQLRPLVTSQHERVMLNELQAWVDLKQQGLETAIEDRHTQGFVRECHGDLHLNNILFRNGKCVPFDCIEFDPNLRWIDTASDLAFTVMDLETHQLHGLAHRLLNEYLAHSGDYGMLCVFPYYLVYRAMVRAKISAIRAEQDAVHGSLLRGQCDDYLRMALSYTGKKIRCLIIMCGFSGTGKTTVARQLASDTSTIHIRSDVERKRLHDLDLLAESRTSGLDIYTKEATERTFDQLAALVESILGTAFGVIVDATFIDANVRRRFQKLAEVLGVPWCIVNCEAAPETIRVRLEKRTGDASEAGYAQFLEQREACDRFSDEEQTHVVTVDTESPKSQETVAVRVLRQMERD